MGVLLILAWLAIGAFAADRAWRGDFGDDSSPVEVRMAGAVLGPLAFPVARFIHGPVKR